MTESGFRRNTVVLVVLALTTALIVRSMIQLELGRRGIDGALAADLSYLAVPPILLLLTMPIWGEAKVFIAGLYRHSDLSLRLALGAIAIGFLMRIAWWAVTVARVSFGWLTTSGGSDSVGPIFIWQCPQPMVLALGILVMAVLVPVIEEIIHRGYVLRGALRWGAPAAIITSALVFTVFHRTGSWPVVFVAGLIFAFQFHISGSLWPSTITHATYNLLIRFDWHCLRGRWMLADSETPKIDIGLSALLILILALTAVVLLVWRTPGANNRPGH